MRQVRYLRRIGAGLVMVAATIGAIRAPACWAKMETAAVHVRIGRDRAVIANPFLAIEIAIEARRGQTVLVKNLRAHTSLALAGDDFTIEFEDGRAVRAGELVLEKAHQEPGVAGGEALVLEYRGRDLHVRMITALKADQWWATRWLEVEGPRGRLAKVNLGHWRCDGARGPRGPGKTVAALGYPSGCGQAVYAEDLFLAVAHPGAENFATPTGISCALPAYKDLSAARPVITRKLILGAGERGAARHAFLRYIDRTRAVPAHMLFLVNDWYWKDKSKPLKAIDALVHIKQRTGVPIDSFTLDSGWDYDWDQKTLLWGRLNRHRFPGGWRALEAAGRPADIGVSLWFGPVGGYGDRRMKRVAFARKVGFEIQNGKLCLAGSRYRRHVIQSFSRWAARGMDYIKVDGFWPDCQVKGHGHPVGPGGAIAQMDSLIGVFAAWRRARRDLVIGYTSGSNPSPFWLQHADFVWRGGRDDRHAGVGAPFDRHNTYLDSILQLHRQTDMPISAFVTFDIVQRRIASADDEVMQRGFWWLAARTSLHHDWYIQASDLSLARWKMLAKAAHWARRHERLFRWSRMVGGDPARGQVYGFAAYDKGRGTLALRNPSAKSRTLTGSLAQLLALPVAARGRSFRLRGVHGRTDSLDGVHAAATPLRVELPPLAIAVFEVLPPGA